MQTSKALSLTELPRALDAAWRQRGLASLLTGGKAQGLHRTLRCSPEGCEGSDWSLKQTQLRSEDGLGWGVTRASHLLRPAAHISRRGHLLLHLNQCVSLLCFLIIILVGLIKPIQILVLLKTLFLC